MKIIKNVEIKYSNSLENYVDSIKFMENRVSKISINKKKELIWFLYHDNIYTMGTSASDSEILTKTDIPLINTNRGGKITYHGPGQRIVYFLINLNNRKKDIRKFINLIEESAIYLLKEFDIEAKTFPDRVGIWVTKNNHIKLDRERKIGAIGLRVKKWITYHGLSFNLNPDLNFYKNIKACGLTGYSATSMQSLGKNINQETFDELYLKFFIKGLNDL